MNSMNPYGFQDTKNTSSDDDPEIKHGFGVKASLPPCQMGLEYTDCIPYSGIRPSPKGWPEYDNKLYPMVRLQFWRSGER